MRLIALLSLFFPLFVLAQKSEKREYFHLPPNSVEVSELRKARYLEILADFQIRFLDEVWLTKQKALIVPNDWESPFFGGYAKNYSDRYEVHVLGGTVRAIGMTETILKTILCHELGHVLGGQPLQTIGGVEWSSSEGQSDFFAGAFCLGELLDEKTNVSKEATNICGGHLKCARVAQAGLDTIRFFQKYSYRKFVPVSLLIKSTPALSNLTNQYPDDQCRVETFVAAALCVKGGSCVRPVCWLPNP